MITKLICDDSNFDCDLENSTISVPFDMAHLEQRIFELVVKIEIPKRYTYYRDSSAI